MTVSVEEADELAGVVGIFLAAGPLLWMISRIGEESTIQMVATFEAIVRSIVTPSPRLIVAVIVLSFVYSRYSDISGW
ncbi:hypothetical protein JCM18237_17270 [Halorubrum luteum]